MRETFAESLLQDEVTERMIQNRNTKANKPGRPQQRGRCRSTRGGGKRQLHLLRLRYMLDCDMGSVGDFEFRREAGNGGCALCNFEDWAQRSRFFLRDERPSKC